MEEFKCITSKENIANNIGNVKFPCPKCAKHTIVRSAHMRAIGAKYACPECGFTGPV